PVVFHCFSGDLPELEKVIESHYYVGIAGPVTFSNSRLPHILPEIPLSHLMIETDSPFLAPVPHRGKRNIPGYVAVIAEAVARILGRPLDDIAAITSRNAGQFFRLDPVLSYTIGSHLYLNLTNRCTNRCSFCPLTHHHLTIGPYCLKLEREPDADQIIRSIPIGQKWDEVVFCGFGEPTLRLDVLIEVARHFKKNNHRIRLNTNGQGNLIHRRNILPELADLIDTISISLNAADQASYNTTCHPQLGQAAFPSLLAFIRESRRYIPEVLVSVVTIPEIDLTACRQMADELQVPLRIRPYREGAL
ncbi:MAG: TatD family nuclease-associated radical SAM protein, partial [Candidatus Delongbacteria bacterium]|nr:TatD family nuclease-associated radical SAM protein [Candidatus Delongbacteria bacterium]